MPHWHRISVGGERVRLFLLISSKEIYLDDTCRGVIWTINVASLRSIPVDLHVSWFCDSRSVVRGHGWRGQGKLDMGIRRTVRMRRMRKAGNETWRWRRISWSLQNTLLLFVSLEGWVQPNGRLSPVLFRLKFWYAPEQLQHDFEDDISMGNPPWIKMYESKNWNVKGMILQPAML